MLSPIIEVYGRELERDLTFGNICTKWVLSENVTIEIAAPYLKGHYMCRNLRYILEISTFAIRQQGKDQLK